MQYRAFNNNPPLRKKSRNFLSGILLFPKNFRLRRAGSYFRLNFNTVFAFKSPKIFRLRRANFRRGLIFLKISEKSRPGVLSCGGYCLPKIVCDGPRLLSFPILSKRAEQCSLVSIKEYITTCKPVRVVNACPKNRILT